MIKLVALAWLILIIGVLIGWILRSGLLGNSRKREMDAEEISLVLNLKYDFSRVAKKKAADDGNVFLSGFYSGVLALCTRLLNEFDLWDEKPH